VSDFVEVKHGTLLADFRQNNRARTERVDVHTSTWGGEGNAHHTDHKIL